MFEQLENRRLLSATLLRGMLTVDGTVHSESIQIQQSGTSLIVKVGSASSSFTAAKVKKILVDAGNGNDRIQIGNSVSTGSNTLAVSTSITLPTTLLGGAGNDTIIGGDGVDFINGGAGNDSLVGGDGNDILVGSSGNDTLRGGAGNDSLHGDSGTNTALTEGDDEVLDCAVDDPANSFVPVGLTDLTITTSVVATMLRPIATVNVSGVPSTAKFTATWTRTVGKKFYIVVDVERSTEDLHPKTTSKSATFDFGKHAVGAYEVDVFAKTGKAMAVQTFTVTAT